MWVSPSVKMWASPSVKVGFLFKGNVQWFSLVNRTTGHRNTGFIALIRSRLGKHNISTNLIIIVIFYLLIFSKIHKNPHILLHI